MGGALFVVLAVLTLASCSRHPPPTGYWEGTYEAGDTMVAARVSIDSKANITVVAPNAEGVGSSDGERATMRQNLAAGLASAWDAAEPRQMDFDGETFRKPGGIS